MSARRQRASHLTGITADLFAIPVPATSVPSAPAPVVTTPAARVRPPTKNLWCAVVFPDLEEAAASVTLQRLCLHALQFTSLVSIELPNALLLEIKGSVRLFGAMQTLQTGIAAVWERLALRAQMATAPTTLAALWLARAGKQVLIEDLRALPGALQELSIACTAWDAERLQTLRSMGVTRIGELMRLPRVGLARRVRPETVLDLDIALARQEAPRRRFVSRERFRKRCDFEVEVETVGYLQKAVEPLIGLCAQFLRERQAGVQALELCLRHRALPVTRMRVGLAGITSDGRRLADVLEERLSRLELPAPVNGMELRSGGLEPLSAASLDAFAGQRGGGRDTAPQLVERLRARLGDTAVYQVTSVAEHRPEAAWQRIHELNVMTVHRRIVQPEGIDDVGMPRPVWLLSEPERFSALELQQLQAGVLVLEEGPERIESGWWDGRGIARDYYVARPACGSKWWVFQERQTRCWYVHGVFA